MYSNVLKLLDRHPTQIFAVKTDLGRPLHSAHVTVYIIPMLLYSIV